MPRRDCYRSGWLSLTIDCRFGECSSSINTIYRTYGTRTSTCTGNTDIHSIASGPTKDCHAYVATVADRYAGFALVDRAAKVGSDAHWMDQFFVVRKYRGAGVGRHLALRVLGSWPGPWEVGQMAENHVAQAFWRSVVAGCTSGEFEERKLSTGRWQGVVQCFRIHPA